MGRPPKHDLSTWVVTDDWPDPVPVTSAEVKVFESRFGDVFDEIFGEEISSAITAPIAQDHSGPAISEKDKARPESSDSL